MNGTEFARISGSYSTAYIGTYQLTGQSTSNNTSTFILRAYFYYGGGSQVSSSYSTFQIDGTTVKTGSYNYGSGYHLLGSKTITVTHNSNGSFPGRSVGIYANSHHINGSNSGGISAPSIARKANVSNATNFNDEGNPTITYSNPGGFRINARLEFAGSVIRRDNISNTGRYTFNLSEAERNLLRSKCPNSNTLTVREVIATCYSGSTEKAWSWQDKTMTIVNANPTFNNFEYEDINPITLALTGNNQNIIPNYSNVKVTIPISYIATSKKQSSMKKYSFTCSDIQRDISYNASEATFNNIENVKSGVFNVYAIDSRNNSTQVTKNANETIEYKPLIKKEISITRDNGISQLTILKLSGIIDLKDFGSVVNSITTSKFRYKRTDEDTWQNYTDITLNVDNNGNYSYNDYILGDTSTGFDISHSYSFEVVVADELSQVVYTGVLVSGIPNIALHKDGVSIMGKYDNNEGGVFQIAGKNIFQYSEDEIDTGYKWIDGKTIYRKVVYVTSVSQNNTINPNLVDLDKIINVYGMAKRPSGYFNSLPCNYTNWEIYLYDYSQDHTVVKFSNNQWNAGVDYLYVIYEYTKS